MQHDSCDDWPQHQTRGHDDQQTSFPSLGGGRRHGAGRRRHRGAARADAAYPNHPVRWVVPYAAGGATDVLSRLICQHLSERLGQPFVVENKPGAGSNIGTQAVIASPPDGYTLLLTSTANAINASFDPTLPFDFAKGIVPVAGVARIPLVLVVNNDLPVRSVAEFIAYAKANPGKMSIASSGIGTSLHLSGELFKAMAGVAVRSRALSRLGAGPDRRDERPDPGHVRQRHLLVRTGALGQAARARRDHAVSGRTRCRTCRRSAIPCPVTRPARSTASAPRTTRRGTIVDLLNAEINAALADPVDQAAARRTRRHSHHRQRQRIRRHAHDRDRALAQGGGDVGAEAAIKAVAGLNALPAKNAARPRSARLRDF